MNLPTDTLGALVDAVWSRGQPVQSSIVDILTRARQSGTDSVDLKPDDVLKLVDRLA
jgi:hypothetical protein